MKKIMLSVLFAVALVVSVHANAVFAQSFVPTILSGNSTTGGASGLLNPSNLGQFLANVIYLLIGIAGFLVLIYLIIAGIKYVMSSGEAEKTGEARKQIIAALIGMAIVLLSYFLVTLVFNVLGITGGATSIDIPCVVPTGQTGAGQGGYLTSAGTCQFGSSK